MSLSLAVAINVVADIAIIALLAFVMSRAARLTPHLPEAALPGNPTVNASRERRVSRPRPRRIGSPLAARS